MTNKQLIRKWVLQNAVKYGGKANPGAVIGKLLAEQPELKANMKEVAMQVNAVIKEISKLTSEQQLAELQKTAPELLEEKKKQEQKHSLPPLQNAVQGKVITAFPPEPSGVAHIGHASGALFNMMYAQQYEGKFILRFEDTNPELAKLEYYQAITELLQWLGIKWDKIVRISDTLPEMYVAAEKLVVRGVLYACDCPVELMRDKRGTGEACLHRNKTPKENLAVWKRMLSGSEEKGIVMRYKGNLNSQNTVMRDPTMFRIIKTPHCIHGTRFVVWPSYDFAAAYSDGAEGITHRVRGKEFELRAELQAELQKLMGFQTTHIIEQARINLAGVEASKRKIRDKIAAGELTGWDDPRLSTLITLQRRGFTPEGIKNFLLSVGITKNERTLEWASLEAENRKIIDPLVNRYFFVATPKKVKITGMPVRTCEVPLHPDHSERGNRIFSATDEFYLAGADVEQLKQRSLYRLIDCCNFTKTSKGFKFHSKDIESYRKKGKRIMHWLPTDKAVVVAVEVVMPDASIVTGLGETALKTLKEGDKVQFQRFGFCRLDKKEKDKLTFWYTHK